MTHAKTQNVQDLAPKADTQERRRAQRSRHENETLGFPAEVAIDNRKTAFEVVKRIFDVCVASVILILLSPLLIVTAIAVKVTSKGNVFFSQNRVGRGGKLFKMYKFRSMVQNAEELKTNLMQSNEQTGPVFKMKNDPRMTSIGKFIRKFSIDELPQLVNVLKGDMTLVGPRPPVPEEVAKYRVWHARRLSVTPGLTCIWQVSGRNRIGFEDWMRMDIRYIEKRNLLMDLVLLCRTFFVVVTAEGAS